MTTATEIIAFLRSRRPRSVVERSTGLPHDWDLWLRNAPIRHGRLTDAPISALLAGLAALGPRPRPRVIPMGRWRALRSLLWQHWEPPPREERGTRWAGGIGSLLLHLGLLAILLLVSLITLPAPPEERDGTRVQLILIGRGTQAEGGGAGPQTPDTGAQAAAAATASKAPSQPSQASASNARQTPATQSVTSSEPTPLAPQAEVAGQAAPATAPVPQPQPDPPQPAPTEQPLQVTETLQPTQEFVLPPVTPPQIELQAPEVQRPQVAARQREIQAVQNQQPVAIQTVLPHSVGAVAPTIPQPQVRLREIPMPEAVPTLQAPALQAVRPKASPAPVQLQSTQPAQARVREIPAPPAPAQSQATATASAASADPGDQSLSSLSPSQAASASSAQSSTGQAEAGAAVQPSNDSPNPGAPPSPVSGGTTAGGQANSSGAGARPGSDWGTPGPKTADDWGAASKVARGSDAGTGQGLKGLFNADGSPKLAGELLGGSTVRPGVPGSRQQAKFDADRAGTWLERPAFGYQPTMFDKYWMPGGTLLQDWVQAGISEMEIPIPGTSKRIKCVVSVLQAGGACGLFDPNKNEQPATARPPPDIPVKRTPIPEGS